MKTGKTIFLLLIICLFIRIVIGEPCFIPSESMEPTLLRGDRVWINKLAYGGKLPIRWADIPLLNIFTWISPLRIADERNKWKYRRLPGYTHPQKGDIVVFNSPSDPHLLLVKRIVQVIEKNDTLTSSIPGQFFYFMEGDNRYNSHDSRTFGSIPEEAIIGKLNFVLFSLTPDISFWKSIRWERILGRLK